MDHLESVEWMYVTDFLAASWAQWGIVLQSLVFGFSNNKSPKKLNLEIANL